MNSVLVFTALCGIFWTITYVECIRIGFKNKTYCMPLWPLALNFAWELTNCYFGYRLEGFQFQSGISLFWLLLDCIILLTYLMYGKKYWSERLPKNGFIINAGLTFIIAIGMQYLMVKDLGFVRGTTYAAFLQNVVMSVMFIQFFLARNGSEGQSLSIAVTKCLGTAAITIVFGIIPNGEITSPKFVLLLGLTCFLFDLIYIYLLYKSIRSESRLSMKTS